MENFYVYNVPDGEMLYMYSFDMFGDELYFATYHWDYFNGNDNLTIYSINPNTGELHGAVVVESTALPNIGDASEIDEYYFCLLYTSPSPRDLSTSRMPSSA